MRIWLVGIVCLAACAGCGGSAPQRPAKSALRPAKATPQPAPVLVHLLTSTGADPLEVEIKVTKDGRAISVTDAGRAGGARHERKLSPATFARLRRLVARTTLAHADRSRIPTPGGSQYIMYIGKQSAVFSTGHTARSVRPLLAALLRLSNSFEH